jgi:hypothetical protein
MHIVAPSDMPSSAARSEPAASITARTSSIRSSSVGAPATGSERPTPRRSKTSTLAKEPSRRRKRDIAGLSHIRSRWERKGKASTRSISPSPNAW